MLIRLFFISNLILMIIPLFLNNYEKNTVNLLLGYMYVFTNSFAQIYIVTNLKKYNFLIVLIMMIVLMFFAMTFYLNIWGVGFIIWICLLFLSIKIDNLSAQARRHQQLRL
jgi:hypothetical protein